MLVVAMVAPILVAQLLSGFRLQLRLTRTNVVTLLMAGVLYALAFGGDHIARVLVPMSVALGGCVLWSVLRRSSTSIAPPTVCAIGTIGNFIPMAMTGAMPVDEQALAGFRPTATEPLLSTVRHNPVALEDLRAPIALLSDVLRIPFIDAIVSVGDILILAGMIMLAVQAGSRSSEERIASASTAAPHDAAVPVPPMENSERESVQFDRVSGGALLHQLPQRL